MPTRDEIIDNLINVLTEIQEMSGRDVPSMDVDLKPLCDLDGFESINAAEATEMLIRRLDLTKLHDIPFFPPKGREEPLSIGEIADQVLRKVGAGK
jgi:hypothetical protein